MQLYFFDRQQSYIQLLFFFFRIHISNIEIFIAASCSVIPPFGFCELRFSYVFLTILKPSTIANLLDLKSLTTLPSEPLWSPVKTFTLSPVFTLILASVIIKLQVLVKLFS